jgi:hypothetical protein
MVYRVMFAQEDFIVLLEHSILKLALLVLIQLLLERLLHQLVLLVLLVMNVSLEVYRVQQMLVLSVTTVQLAKQCNLV